ncbi:U3 small nucleolar RNA-associated protein 18 -like protein [Toxocara canis]|uniref:U3 small nucleolar RNA-associated protein 18-like protein n=1 Tax=Toxocara canis TaxID=6265 RepID=A0A0B2UVA1_TOXCA|nr:U3 small nucleolar RNA-associated protein 18 -like protein [Toxocara canis]
MKKGKKGKKRRARDELTENSLAKKLFGTSGGLKENDESSSEESHTEEADVHETSADESSAATRKQVWHDEDDETEVSLPRHRRDIHLLRTTDSQRNTINAKEYEKRLRETFIRTRGSGQSAPKWAAKERETSMKLSHDVEDSDESEAEEVEVALRQMTASTGAYIQKGDLLPKGVISVSKTIDITRGHRQNRFPLRALQFHPVQEVVMTGSENGTISLFEVGLPESEEHFMQDVHFKGFPITCAAFDHVGTNIIAGSKKRSMEYVQALTTPSFVTSVQFSPNSSNMLYAMTDGGEVFIWDIRRPEQQKKFSDEGAVHGTVVHISRNEQFIACGSNTGIVNLYEMGEVLKTNEPKPLACFDQLTTSADFVCFSGDSQVLAMSSSVKGNAVRIAHVRSRSVFSNFPPRNIRLGKATRCDFSRNSGYFAVGDYNGYLSLFRLNHFDKY